MRGHDPQRSMQETILLKQEERKMLNWLVSASGMHKGCRTIAQLATSMADVAIKHVKQPPELSSLISVRFLWECMKSWGMLKTPTYASIGWYNQSLASGASKAHGSIIHSKNQVKRKFSGDQRDHPKMTKLVENPSVVGWNVKSNMRSHYWIMRLTLIFHNPTLRGTCFRCWKKHAKGDCKLVRDPLPRPSSLPINGDRCD